MARERRHDVIDIRIGQTRVQRQRQYFIARARGNGTPRRLLIELNAIGTDYLTHGDYISDDFDENWQVLHDILEDAHDKLTRKEIDRAWPDDYPKPAPMTLWRWLDRAVHEKRIFRDGLGRSRKPFRYWLAGQEERWKYDSMHFEQMPSLEDDMFDTIDTCMKNRQEMDKKKEQRKQKRLQKKAAAALDELDDDGLEG